MLSSPRFWLSLLSLAAVLVLLMVDLGERISPGALGASHALVPELQGGDSCGVCHGDGPEDLPRACGECHTEVRADIEAGTGLHGTLELAAGGAHPSQTPIEDCGACHGEHHGGNLPAVSDHSFVLAGFASLNDFDHERLDLQLVGAHEGLGCVECHANAEVRALEDGQLRFHGLDRSCTPCHDDPHGGRIVWDCEDCHGQMQPFAELETFAHTSAFELAGAHALTAREDCAGCHEPSTTHGVEALAGTPRELLDHANFRRCAECHDSPHSPALLEGSDELASAASPLTIVPAHGPAGDCAACHDTSLVGFEAGGTDLGDRERAAALHAGTGFALDAPHGELACDACHSPDLAAEAGAEAAFGLRFPGRDALTCAACHEDPHESANGPSCTDCHQASGPWNDLSLFDHHPDFALAGVHSQLECAACHAEAGPTSVAELGLVVDLSGTGSTDVRACATCHADPHRADFLAGVVALLPEAIGATGVIGANEAGDSCAACHLLEHEPAARGGPGFRVPAADLPVDLHGASGFDLTAPHADLACATCHGDPAALVPVGGRSEQARAELTLVAAGSEFRPRFPGGRAPDDCATCHFDPHEGRLTESAIVLASERQPAPGGCRVCHDDHHFQPSLVDDVLHAASGFALDGGHAAVGCYACHERGTTLDSASSTARFAGAPTDCAACHDDVHDGAFATSAGGCADCHVTSGFHEVAAVASGEFDHGALCGFALEGAHSRADCSACHGPEPGWPSAEGAREFGRVAAHFPGDPGRCETCHADPHEGAFDQAAVPQDLNGETGCARCHGQESFALDEGTPFDHGLWTGYQLVGPHAATGCVDCHGRLASTDAGSYGGLATSGSTRLGKVPGTSCADCHADVHLGQFRTKDTGSTDCEACHTVPSGADDGWLADQFDHALTFVLDESHAQLDCAACHLPWPLQGGGEVVRYRPLGRECKDCHGTVVPEQQR